MRTTEREIVGKFKLREELRGPSHGFDVWVTEGRNQG
jgi:hypothetical protein